MCNARAQNLPVVLVWLENINCLKFLCHGNSKHCLKIIYETLFINYHWKVKIMSCTQYFVTFIGTL